MELDAIRDRAAKAASAFQGTQPKYDSHFPIRASARDVPDLLALVAIVREQWEKEHELAEGLRHALENEREKAKAIRDAVSALVVAAMNFVQNDDDTGALEALVEAADTMPWTVLDDLGIPRDEEG